MERKDFTKPVHVTTWMAVFLALVAALAAALVPQLKHAFIANAAFNGVILFVLAVGIAVNLRQVWRLQREVLWIDSFYRDDIGQATSARLVLSYHRNTEEPNMEANARKKRKSVIRSIYDLSTPMVDTYYREMRKRIRFPRYYKKALNW